MATINTTMSFRDEVSQKLNLLNNAMTGLSRTMRMLQTDAKKTGDETDRLGEKSGILSKLFSFNQAAQAFGTVKNAVGGVVGVFGQLNGMYQAQMDAEARLSAVMGARMKADAAGIADMTKYIDEFSKGSAYNKTMLTNAAQELGTYIEKADTLKGLLPMLTSMSQQAGLTNEQGLMSMATMIGKVMAGDMGGLTKRGWTFTDSEKAAFKLMDEEQRLNFLANTATENIGKQDKAIAEMMANLAKQRELENLQMKVGGLVGPALDALGQLSLVIKRDFYSAFATAAEKVVPYIVAIVEKIQSVYTAITSKIVPAVSAVSNFIQTNIRRIVIAFATITAAIMTVVAAYAILHAAQIKEIALEVKKNAIKLAGFIATHSQLLIIIGIILAVIAAIGLILAYSEKTFPAIGGFLGGLAETTKEVGAVMKHAFQIAIEGIVNGFRNMKDNVSDFFISMLDVILKGIERIAPAIDAVFKTDMAGKIGSFRSTLNELKNTEPEQFSLGWRDERRGFATAWESGKALGAAGGINASNNLKRWIDEKLGKLKGALPNLTPAEIGDGVAAGMSDTFEFDGSGSLQTSDNSLKDIAQDYRSLLSQTALTRFNAIYKNVKPEVKIDGVIFNNGADPDVILQKLTDSIESVSESSLRTAS